MSAIVSRIRHQFFSASPAKRAGLILLALAAFSVVGTSAWAFWTTFGSGSASATTGTLNAPTLPIATNTAGSSTVGVSWTPSTGSTVPQGYYITRIKSDSTTEFACGSTLTTFVTSPCTDSGVPDGTFHYTVTAVYHSWSATSASSGNVTVTSSIATTTTVGSSPSPSVVGQSVTYTATVTPNSVSTTPTGTVTFKDGSTAIACTGGSQTLNSSGVATCQFTYTSVGTHSITAVYAGAGSFTASTSTALAQTVNQASTTTSMTSSGSPSVTGQSVTYTATVAAVSPGAGTATGTVSFMDGVVAVACSGGGSQTLNAFGVATCQLVYAGVGTHSITGVYSGDTNFLTSTSTAFTQTVNKASTTTTVVSSVNPSVTGQSVTYTATVAAVSPGAGTPAGSVTFKDGAATITCTGGSTTLSAGVATCQLVYAGVGTHSITGVYSGDINFLTSTSTAFTQTVNQATSISSLAITNKSGGIAGKAEAGDKITSTFSAGLQVSSICSAWTGNGSNQTNSTANVRITDNGTTGNDIVTITTWSGCPASFAFGSIDLGSQAYVAGTGGSIKPADFSGSTVAYDTAAHTITITLGTVVTGGTQGALGTVASSIATLTADAAVKDINGSSIFPLTKATGNILQF
jgi:Bacterial Ig-like domain (group 3)